jgi:hypothetical protein
MVTVREWRCQFSVDVKDLCEHKNFMWLIMNNPYIVYYKHTFGMQAFKL